MIEGARRLFAGRTLELCKLVAGAIDTYERALVFLLLRLRRRTRFFLHLALILSASYCEVSGGIMWCGVGGKDGELQKQLNEFN